MSNQDKVTQRIWMEFVKAVEPFTSLLKTPRGLMGIYISYFLEGLVYFGILTILGKYLSENVGLSDLHAGWVMSFLTGGITLSMLFLGGTSDRLGVRKVLISSLAVLVLARFLLASSGQFFEWGQGLFSPMFWMVIAGLLIVIIGYGAYMPASYAGVKQFTDEKTSTMAYAMLYGLMNLGAFCSGIISPIIRQGYGIQWVFWLYVILTLLACLSVVFFITKDVEKRDTKTEIKASEETPTEKKQSLFTDIKFLVLLLGWVIPGLVLLILYLTRDISPLKKEATNIEVVLSSMVSDKGLDRDRLIQDGKKLIEYAESIKPVQSPKVYADIPMFEMLKKLVIAKGRFLVDLGMKHEQALTQSKIEKDKIKNVLMEVRSIGIEEMAVAYALTGQVDKNVIDTLRRRMKHGSEETVLIDEKANSQILDWVKMDRLTMIKNLSDDLQRRGNTVLQILGRGDHVISMSMDIDAQVLNGISEMVRDEAIEFIQQYLVMSSLYYLSVLPEMIQGEKHDDTSLALARISNDNETLSSLFSVVEDQGIKTPFAVKFLAWAERYGIVLLIGIVFLIMFIGYFLRKRPDHPFRDLRFVFFIFILIPVQTLFAHNWLTIPYYINRTFGGTWVGDNFEFFSNINPILIFILTPLVAGLTANKKPYTMMISGTFVMALPTFLLAIKPDPLLLLGFIFLMSVGEAMWQPRFLQWIAEIAPKGKTGAYMGIGQFPWFLTKVLTGLYSGWFLSRYCPMVGPQDTQTLWLIYGLIAIISPVSLLIAKGWMEKGKI